MRIAAYVQLRRTIGLVSGVGKHVANAPITLASIGDEVRLLAGKDQFNVDGRFPPESALSCLPCERLPWSARTIEWGGVFFGRPRIDQWAQGCDWVYCPAETLPSVSVAPLAVTLHTSDWAEPSLPWSKEWRYRKLRARWRLWFRAVRRTSVTLLSVSEFLRNRLIDLLGLAPSSIHVVGNGVDCAFFEADVGQALSRSQNRAPYVVVVGGLSYYKGGDRVVAVARRMPDLRFVVIGSSLGSQPDLPANIECVPYLSVVEGLPTVVAGAVALLHLSRYETFGIPVAEALAAGVVPIAGPVGAIPEVLGGAGIVTNPDDAAEISNLIEMLVSDQKQRASLIETGRIRAENYRWPKIATRIHETLLSERPSRAFRP